MSRRERLRKTEIPTEVAHVTHDSDTTYKVKRSKVNLQGTWHIVAASRTACILCFYVNNCVPTCIALVRTQHAGWGAIFRVCGVFF